LNTGYIIRNEPGGLVGEGCFPSVCASLILRRAWNVGAEYGVLGGKGVITAYLGG
jgi:hypothetical protein